MPIKRLNHAVLYVRNAERSSAFYAEVLGFGPATLGAAGASPIPGVVFLRAPDSTNDHDLALFSVGESAAASPAGRGAVGLYHLAWEVRTLSDLQDHAARLTAAGALVGASDHGTTKALYGRDLDGIEFEVMWLVPADRIDAAAIEARSRIEPLDLPAEIERYGADTEGGVGVSERSFAG
ncbi:MAG TPA: VOC family protein [Candidatus Limnocylindria bacterium]|nr:VOC family protein [Candidatus Limnocylindria bacterium]